MSAFFTRPTHTPLSFDIFCTVIDNYGDIGIAWRLARQLMAEHGVEVHLWVDDLAAFARIQAEVLPEQDRQTLMGVEICHWVPPMPDVTPANVVIEALACHLPEDYVARMAATTPKPIWLNLEYLTAEDWAAGVHGLPSPNPRWPLTQYFFVPGFVPATGGLLREAPLVAMRKAFQASPLLQAAFWQHLGVPAALPNELRVSLFCYENRALPTLLTDWASGSTPLRVLVPHGKALPEIAAWLGVPMPHPGEIIERGALTVHVLPMLDQAGYDHLLWACDINFVRGEDSFVRAQLAARPMVWQAYKQDDEAHLDKLAAFLNLYCANQPAEAATRTFWLGWNREALQLGQWQDWQQALPTLQGHAKVWAEHLESQPDLAANLMIFCEKLRQEAKMSGFSDPPSGHFQ